MLNSPLRMESSWLANIDPASDWTRLPTGAFSTVARQPGALAILPVFGCSDHGLGLPLNVEEVIGSELLRRACTALRTAGGHPWVLPPLRFGPAPYPAQYFGFDPDDGLDWLRAVTDGIRRAGFSRLVLVTTSPWHVEWVNAGALDLHVETGLKVFKLHLENAGLTLHPTAPLESRQQMQAVGASLLQTQPGAASPGITSDPEFRPGCFLQPSPVEPASPSELIAPQDWLRHAGTRCARLLAEATGQTLHIQDTAADSAGRVWNPYGARYLPGLAASTLKALPDLDRSVALIPLSAIEQHGNHLPVGVDALLGEGLLRAALAQLPSEAPVWVALPINVGKSIEHQSFAGTLSLSSRTLRTLLTSQIEALAELGFGTIAIWNTHGGNSAVLTYTLRELQTRLGVRIGRLESGYQPRLSPHETAFGFHAGQWETSLMLALAPELVKTEATICEYPVAPNAPGELRPERGAITQAWVTADLSTTGVMGDATAATKASGEHWIQETAIRLASRLLHLTRATSI